MPEPTSPESAGPVQKLNCRVYVRRPCNIAAECSAEGTATELSWKATIRDLSAGGIGLAMSQPLQPGQLISVQVSNEQKSFLFLRQVRVKHIRVLGPDEWFVGGEFLHMLSPRQMGVLLTH